MSGSASQQNDEWPLLTDELTEVSADDHALVVKALNDAQNELTNLKDKQREERVGWIVVSTILLDCALFLNASNAIAPVMIGLMQIAVLAILAKRLGVEEFYALFARIVHRMADVASGKGD